MQPASPPALIALDWGTTSLRAWLMAGPSKIIDSRSAPWGIMHLPKGGFPGALQALCGDWLGHYPTLPVIACGMVGSAQGWVEAPYVHAPASCVDVARRLKQVQGPVQRKVSIVPGVLLDAAQPNVMRGEETQVFGAMATRPEVFGPHGSRLLVLPGTHSKWVALEQGGISDFMTTMTGEMFAVLRQHSILGRLMTYAEEFDHVAFERGLEESACSAGVMSSLFTARSLALVRRLEERQVGDYLSGLLIGHEIREACQLFGAVLVRGIRLPVIGAQGLRDRYHVALAWHGIAVDDGDFSLATQAGLWHVAQSAGLLGG